MSRCRCCNVHLSSRDVMVYQEDGKEEDLCMYCLGIAYHPERCEASAYQFSDLTEIPFPYAVTPRKRDSDSL